MLTFENLDAANRAHAAKLGTGTVKRRSDLHWAVLSFLATVLFGAFIVWLVLPRGAFEW